MTSGMITEVREKEEEQTSMRVVGGDGRWHTEILKESPPPTHKGREDRGGGGGKSWEKEGKGREGMGGGEGRGDGREGGGKRGRGWKRRGRVKG